MKKNYYLKYQRLLALLFAFLIAIVAGVPANAQSLTLKGKVIASADKLPLPGVGVKIKGSSSGTTTDAEGNFAITSKAGDVLVFSFIGFKDKQVTVGSSNNITVRLETDVAALDEVVVVGYGTMKKTDLTSSQVTISAGDIQRTNNTTIDQALQGRAANVYVNSNSGQPGAAPSVIIRGISSLSLSNQPLYVIDGVQIKLEKDPDGTTSNPLAGINPDDIETINVLQGPSATSIYGAAGATGVVVLTTKKGKAGATKITANTSTSIQSVPRLVPVMNLREWAEYRNIYAAAGAATADPLLADPSILGEGTNWQEELFRNTIFSKNTLSLSGGNEKTLFYVSGEYLDQQGVAVGSGFKRYSTTLNLTNETRSWLKIGTNLGLNRRNEIVGVTNQDILRTSVRQNPSIAVRNANGSWAGPSTAQFQENNPIALASVSDYKKRMTEMRVNVFADIKPLKGLTFRNQFGGTLNNGNEYNFLPTYQFGGLSNLVAESTRRSSNDYSYNFVTQLNYDFKVRKHSITSMLAHEIKQWGYENLSGTRRGFVSNNIQDLNLGDALTASNSGGKGASATEGYFGRINYVYNNKYIAQFTYRADGSSNFGQDNRWGYFPSASVAWRMSEENFMKNIPIINDLKLRFEYGLSGNSPYENRTVSLMTPVPTGNGTGFLSDNFSNPDLKWEVTTTTNIGFDLHMLNNRIELIADAYIKNIDDLITTEQAPYYSGGDIAYSAGYVKFPPTNVGSMRNRGFGITLNTTNINKRDLTWKTGLNFSLDRNKIGNLYSSAGLITTQFNSSLQTNSKPGQTVGLYTGYIYEGLFQTIDEIKKSALPASVLDANKNPIIDPSTGVWVGDIKYKDVNGDGMISELDRTVIGNPWPKFTFGFNNSLSYKGLDFTMFFTGSYGNEAFNYTRFEVERPNGASPNSNYYRTVYNFARPSSLDKNDANAYLTNPGHDIARISLNDVNGNNRATQNFVEDASYLRLKTLDLGYSFPKNLVSKAKVLSGLRAGVRIQNVFTITKYKGYDPEVGLSGIDRGRYPSSRMYSFNLTADF